MYTFARQQLSLCLMYALLLSSANGWTTNGFTRLGLGCQWLDFRELQRSVTPPDTTMHSECLVLFDVRVVLVLHIFLLEGRLRFIELPPTAGLLMSL